MPLLLTVEHTDVHNEVRTAGLMLVALATVHCGCPASDCRDFSMVAFEPALSVPALYHVELTSGAVTAECDVDLRDAEPTPNCAGLMKVNTGQGDEGPWLEGVELENGREAMVHVVVTSDEAFMLERDVELEWERAGDDGCDTACWRAQSVVASE